MNRERAKELWPIIQALAEGEMIQYRGKDSLDTKWKDLERPENVEFARCFEFRIKPEPREVWLVVHSDDWDRYFDSKGDAERHINQNKIKNYRIIHMRSVED